MRYPLKLLLALGEHGLPHVSGLRSRYAEINYQEPQDGFQRHSCGRKMNSGQRSTRCKDFAVVKGAVHVDVRRWVP